MKMKLFVRSRQIVLPKYQFIMRLASTPPPPPFIFGREEIRKQSNFLQNEKCYFLLSSRFSIWISNTIDDSSKNLTSAPVPKYSVCIYSSFSQARFQAFPLPFSSLSLPLNTAQAFCPCRCLELSPQLDAEDLHRHFSVTAIHI